MALDGSNAQAVFSGEPLESPSGVFIDEDEVAWVMDQKPSVLEGF